MFAKMKKLFNPRQKNSPCNNDMMHFIFQHHFIYICNAIGSLFQLTPVFFGILSTFFSIKFPDSRLANTKAGFEYTFFMKNY